MRRAAAAAAIVVLAAGCAPAPLQPPEAGLEFQVLGRIAARYNRDGFTGNVDWRHAKSGDDMLISTPVGQGVARIVREGEAVQLTTANGRQYRAPDAEALTEQALGFRLPLEGLAEWVRAQPASPAAKVQRSADGKVASIDERGWHIQYLDYENDRPKLMELNYPGVRLRFAISEWK